MDSNMKKTDPVLCYVENCWAYFTTQNLEDQWGDDWDDAPYEYNADQPYHEYNADQPYQPNEDRGEFWEIIKIAWEGDFIPPHEGYLNSPFSVKQINAGAIAWLRTASYVKTQVIIPAGTPLSKFKQLVKAAGGEVYTKDIE